MYGQGSYNSPSGRGPPAPLQPPYQQLLPRPTPLPPHFHQGPPNLPPPPLFQRGSPNYQHGPPPIQHPAVREVPQGAAAANSSQPYVHQQPAAHGSTQLPQMYSTDQQNGHLPSHVGTQNVHHMLRGIPPHPSRVLPPPPPTNNYRASAHQQSQHPNLAQDLPPPPPPTPISSTFTSSPIGSFVQSMSRNSAMHLPPPPPLNYSMTASAHHEAASNLSSSNKPLLSETSTPDFFDNDVTTDGLRHNVSHNDELSRQDGPIAPPKPTKEKVVQKIEDFCLLIAKNGPGYEDWVRQNESGNPEFEFLFSGDPGSEAAIAHEFFLWTKKKVMLTCKLNERSESLSRPSGTHSPMQSNHLEVESRTYSPADSDMEMEDDITQPSNDPCVDHSTEVKAGGCGLIHSDLDVKELLHKQQILESENGGSDVPVTLVQAEKVVSIPDLLALEGSVSTVYSSVISSDNEHPTYIEKSATTSVDEKFPSGASPASQGVDSEKKSSQLIKGGCTFDDVSGNDSEKQPESVSPLKVSSSVAVGASSQVIGLHFSASAVNFHVDSGRDGKEELGMASMTSGTSDEKANLKNQADSRHAKSPPEFYKKYVSEDAGVESCLNGNFQKESAEKDAKAASNSIKVDEFGRLVREGASESDSDDSRYNGRRGKRGRSRSRSPLERHRRRSPRRRRKRSRSRSLSPIKRRSRSRSSRNQRSRSRSPRNRRSRSRSPRNRRSRSRSPRRRRNSRSPAQRHVGEFSGNGMRRDRAQIPGCFDFRLGRCFRGASCRYVHHDSEKVDGSKHHRSKQQHLEVPPISRDSNFQEEIKHNTQKESNQQHHVVKMQLGQELPGRFDQDSQSIDPHTVRSDTFKLHGDTSDSGQNILMMPSQSKLPEPLLQNASCPPQRTDISYICDSHPEQTSVHNISLSEAVPSSIDFRHHSAQLPPPLAFSQCVTAPSMTQPQGDYNLIPQSTSFTCQSASGERFPYMLPSQKSNFYSPPVPSWTVLPPPPSIVPSQIQPYAAELATPSQAGAFQQQSFPPMQEANRSISLSEESRLQNLPPYNRQSKQFIGHGPSREDQLTDLSTLGLSTSSSFPQGDHQHVPQPFSRELSTRKLQTSFADNFLSTELFQSPLQIHPQLQQQQPNNSGQQSASVSSSSKFLPDLQEVKKAIHLPDLRVSRNSSYCDPSASNIKQPLSSKFSSEDLRQDHTAYINKYASPSNMSHGQVDVTEIGSAASTKAASSPNSAKAVGQNFARSGGDQYDPLLDSFEPSSNISKETKNVNKWEPSSDSDILLRHSGLNKPLDVSANNKKEIGNLDVATAAFHEDYGESAYADVDAVENESPGSPTDAANRNEGDIEIDQTMSPSKSKTKESRPMKLFRVALADFVKEVLKPSWRQGNMSKEAFKTIVKKTVDKVAGAMKSHQIPKSQAKIDHYIASSERKLTKLVTGYVDKYVKM